jgi:hypothetical protein
MDTAPERYALNVASATAAVSGLRLAGAYLHGSAVLGGFNARRSDVDVLAVCDGPMTAAQQSAVAEALSEQRLPCPGRGLELSIVTLQVARHPVAEPAFELHLTTAPEDTKVIDGHQRGGDPDLVLHFAMCRTAGRPAWRTMGSRGGPPGIQPPHGSGPRRGGECPDGRPWPARQFRSARVPSLVADPGRARFVVAKVIMMLSVGRG